jgi:hypothetical protein
LGYLEGVKLCHAVKLNDPHAEDDGYKIVEGVRVEKITVDGKTVYKTKFKVSFEAVSIQLAASLSTNEATKPTPPVTKTTGVKIGYSIITSLASVMLAVPNG